VSYWITVQDRHHVSVIDQVPRKVPLDFLIPNEGLYSDLDRLTNHGPIVLQTPCMCNTDIPGLLSQPYPAGAHTRGPYVGRSPSFQRILA